MTGIKRQHSREDLVNFMHEVAADIDGLCRHMWETRINEQMHVMGFNINGVIFIGQWYEGGKGWDVWIPTPDNSVNVARDHVMQSLLAGVTVSSALTHGFVGGSFHIRGGQK